MKIILKADDFWSLGPNKDFLKFTTSKQIKINLGIVGSGLQSMNIQDADFIKSQKHIIEPFNHSWLHLVTKTQKEFHNTTEDYQRQSIAKTQEIIKRILDHDCQTIGFPANASDNTAVKIITETPEIKNVFYPIDSWNYLDIEKVKTIIPINGYGVMELNGQVNFDIFRAGLAELINEKTVTFQLHPNSWTNRSLNEFTKCCDHLINQGHKFIFASAYEK